MVKSESIFFDDQAAAGGDLAAFRDAQVPAGRHDARATAARLRGNAPAAGTQPLANNLYQGMTLDAATGLYYERLRNYSPSLGTVLRFEPKSRHTAGAVPWENSQYAAQYPGAAAHTGSGRSGLSAVEISFFSVEQGSPASSINGANTYQFVMGNPVSALDPTGRDIYLLSGDDSHNSLVNWFHESVGVGQCGHVTAAFSFGKVGWAWFPLKFRWLYWKSLTLPGLLMEGEVYQTDGFGKIIKTKHESAAKDKMWLFVMGGTVGDKDVYSVLRHSCRMFSQKVFNDAPNRVP